MFCEKFRIRKGKRRAEGEEGSGVGGRVTSEAVGRVRSSLPLGPLRIRKVLDFCSHAKV